MGGQASHFVSPAIITTLPNDILLSICNALTDGGDSSSLVPLACTCRDLHQIVFETPTIWLNVFASRFDLHDFHRDPTFDALLELQRREDCLRDAALSGERFELLKEMVVEHVEHNIKRVAGSPAGRAVISFKDLTADTTELALVSAVLQYQPIQPIRATMVIVLNSVRRGQMDHYRLTNGEKITSKQALYQTVHIAMIDFLKNIQPPLLPTMLPTLTPASPNYLAQCLAQFGGTHNWTGYYTYGTDQRRCDEPMYITLRLSPVHHTLHHTHELTGEGEDQHGPFTIQGTVNERSEGRFSFLKQYQYNGGVCWDYKGMLLPYGLVGHYAFGALWLWIRD